MGRSHYRRNLSMIRESVATEYPTGNNTYQYPRQSYLHTATDGAPSYNHAGYLVTGRGYQKFLPRPSSQYVGAPLYENLERLQRQQQGGVTDPASAYDAVDEAPQSPASDLPPPPADLVIRRPKIRRHDNTQSLYPDNDEFDDDFDDDF